jgi:hypothetical protein
MVDTQETIKAKLEKHFAIDGAYSISDSGVVSVQGDVEQITRSKSLPVKFGVVTRHFRSLGKGLINLTNFPTDVGGNASITFYPQMGGILRLLVAQKRVDLHNFIGSSMEVFRTRTAIQAILDKYAGQGKRGVIKCQKELIAAGFERYARW